VEKLLQFGRPRAALGCLDRLVFEKAAIPPKVVVRTLMASVDTTEELTGFDMHSVVELVQWLQENPSTDPDDLFRAEWAYLPLLDGYSGGRPKTLEMRLASDSSFFCEVIAAAFKSEMQSAEAPQPNEQQKNIARMAYGLLNEWQTVPGARADGTFDGQTLAKWLSEVVPAVKKSGHFRVAMSHIGQVLAHAPADPSGLWIHVSAAEALNAKESDAMRSGFMCKQVNMRGVHGYSAGEEERQIAAGFHQKAEQLEERGYHRIATTMRDLAKGYERDANREAQRNPLEA